MPPGSDTALFGSTQTFSSANDIHDRYWEFWSLHIIAVLGLLVNVFSPLSQ